MTGSKDLDLTASGDAHEVLLFEDEFGILVQGTPAATQAVISRLLDQVEAPERSTARVPLADLAAVGASGAALAASSGEYLRLSAESLAKVREFGPQFDSAGAMRGYVRDHGRFAGQLSFEPVSLAAEQALALQTAAVSLALRSAIANVQKAVERVEDKVGDIQQHLDSRLRGDVVGTYRHLEAVTEATTSRGRLLDADWQGVAGVRNQIYRDLETLRANVTRLASGTWTEGSVPKRASKLRDFQNQPGSLVDMLRLILVAEQSLHLYEYLRLHQVRRGDPEFVESAVAEARASLARQQQLDAELVERVLAVIERVRKVDPLEIHHVWSKGDLDDHARLLHEAAAEFAEASRLRRLPELDEMRVSTFADARAVVKGHVVSAGAAARELGSAAASGGSEILRRSGQRIIEPVRARGRRQSDVAPPSSVAEDREDTNHDKS